MDPIGMGKKIVEGAKSVNAELDKRPPHQLKLIIYAIIVSVLLGGGGYYLWSQIISPWIERNTIQPGTIEAFGGETVPDGWLLCDGRWFTRESIQDGNNSKSINLTRLYDSIGEKFGNGGDNQNGQASLPDLRGMFLRGADGQNHSKKEFRDIDPRTVGTLQLDGTKEGTHRLFVEPNMKTGPIPWEGFASIAIGIGPRLDPRTHPALLGTSDYAERNGSGGTDSDVRADGGYTIKGPMDKAEHSNKETRPKNVAVNWIIKY